MIPITPYQTLPPIVRRLIVPPPPAVIGVETRSHVETESKVNAQRNKAAVLARERKRP